MSTELLVLSLCLVLCLLGVVTATKAVRSVTTLRRLILEQFEETRLKIENEIDPLLPKTEVKVLNAGPYRTLARLGPGEEGLVVDAQGRAYWTLKKDDKGRMFLGSTEIVFRSDVDSMKSDSRPWRIGDPCPYCRNLDKGFTTHGMSTDDRGKLWVSCKNCEARWKAGPSRKIDT